MRLVLGVFCLFIAAATVSAQGTSPPADSQAPATKAQPKATPIPKAPPEVKPDPAPASPPKADTPASTKKAVESPTAPTVGKAKPSPAAKEAQEEPSDDSIAIEFLLIASGGMSGQLGTTTKIESIRAAMKNAFRYIPGDIAVGLRVSGHRIGQEEPEKSCQDSELILSPAPQAKSALLQKLGTITPKGNRSIAKSLSRAIVDLEKQTGPKVLILIADGAEGCLDQDPATYLAASSLAGRGYTIHVRGLGLTEEASQQLKVLSDATGGTFANAEDPFALTQQLTIAVQKAVGAKTEIAKPKPTPIPKTAEAKTKEKKPTVAATKQPSEKKPIPAAPPPSGVVPEPKEPPSVGPTPLPFDPNKFRKQIVADLLKNLPKQKVEKGAGKTSPTFSTLALIIMGTEAFLLLVALISIAILLIKKPTSE